MLTAARALNLLVIFSTILTFTMRSLGCRTGTSRTESKLPDKELPVPEQPTGNSPSSDENELSGLDQTTITLGGTALTITIQDARAIKAALVGFLGGWKGEDREVLLRDAMSDTAWIDSEGDLRIGDWLLEANESHLLLRRRDSPGQFSVKAHVAHLSRTSEGRWAIERIERQHIRVQRRD